MEEHVKQKFRELEETGYLNGIREFAMARSAPFFSSAQMDGNKPRLLRNGSITYVATGARELGITNAHVYDKYVEHRAEYGDDVIAQFGGNTIYPERRCVDRNRDLDLTTLDVPKLFLDSNMAGKQHNRPAKWPPAPLKDGELVIYGGYPGALRAPKTGELEFPFQSFTSWRPQVTGSNIILHVDFPNLFWPGHEEKKMNENLSGISGGPVFRLDEEYDPNTGRLIRVGFELVGIIYEYIEMVQTVRARHIHHVLADGRIQASV